ncbi:hypothetical protein INR49_005747 [Caranx melampygus]|nr:hypothetical protein INR49_005747 [Caranx melampygus]
MGMGVTTEGGGGGERWREAGRRGEGEREREVLPLVLPRLFDSVAVAETTPLPATVNPRNCETRSHSTSSAHGEGRADFPGGDIESLTRLCSQNQSRRLAQASVL